MNRRHIRIGAIAALFALTLGVTGTAAAEAAPHRETAAVASISPKPNAEPTFPSPGVLSGFLGSPEGRQLLKGESLTNREAVSRAGDDSAATKGFLDKLKKEALKKAFKALPGSWQKTLTSWAKKGKGYFERQWDSLPGWIKKSLTLGGAISAKAAIEWIIDTIL